MFNWEKNNNCFILFLYIVTYLLGSSLKIFNFCTYERPNYYSILTSLIYDETSDQQKNDLVNLLWCYVAWMYVTSKYNSIVTNQDAARYSV